MHLSKFGAIQSSLTPWVILLTAMVAVCAVFTVGATESWASRSAEAAGDSKPAEESGPGAESKSGGKNSLPFAIRAIAAALAIGLSALATGFAQGRIGAAGMGTMAEKPELAGRVILLVAIPETLVILGFVIATLIIL